MTIKLNKIAIYPIRFLPGITLEQAYVKKNGLRFDRQFVLTDSHGKFIVFNRQPFFDRFTSKIINEAIIVKAPDNKSIRITYRDFSSSLEPTDIEGTRFFCHIASIKLNRWFSHYLQQDVQLRLLRGNSNCSVSKFPINSASFARDYPISLINRASFNYLIKRSQSPLTVCDIKTNFIISGVPAFAEYHWKRIKIGDITFKLVKNCTCYSLRKGNEILANQGEMNKLAPHSTTFRSDERGYIDFGINLTAANDGKITLDDSIEILETEPEKNYNMGFSAFLLDEDKSITIHYQNLHFQGNTRQTILEQLEQQHITIPYSCRSGICGRCQIELVSGEVTPLVMNAINAEGKILACSCIPKTDITLR